MKLSKIALEITRPPLPPLPSVGELLTTVDRKQFYPFIWEPSNRETFHRADIDSFLANDPHPTPQEADRDHYFADRPIEYWVSGLTDYLKVVSTLEAHGRPSTGIDYLDMGCCSGRVLRHFAAHDPSARPLGCDLNGQAIHWVHRHLPHLRAFQNHALPHLPLEDRSLDCVTAYSVLTHIDEFEESWLLELRRILRPGGLALITNHGDSVWEAIPTYDFIYNRLKEFEGRNSLTITPELFAQPIPNDRLAFYTGDGTANRIALYRSNRYIRERWGQFFDVLAIEPRGHLFHDLVVLQKPFA